jgi:aminopeptidase 2
MGATQDPALLEQTFAYILTKSRDQDITYFFRGLAGNFLARRPLAAFFKENYDVLYKRFEGSVSLQPPLQI